MQDNQAFRGQWVYVAGLAAISLVYYAAYITSGFNFSDDGSYAQLAYELYLGRDIHELTLNYGVLWFKTGQLLFELFGVNFIVVKVFFFVCITATSVLVFQTTSLVSGNRAFATLVTAVPLLVPAFPATAFYGLCVMMNVAAQMRLATRLSGPSVWDAGIAGAVLSLSFQIRPDFGYIFILPLAAILLMTGRPHWRALSTAALAGFVAAQLPLLALAISGGYADLVVRQYASYPALIAHYAVSGLGELAQSSTQTAVGTVLQRPPLRAIIGDDGNAAQLALLIYAPIAVVGAFAAYFLATLRRRWRAGQRAHAAQSVAALAAAATLPHYFLYRPDMSHVANFMPGYVVLGAVFMWQLYQMVRTGPRWRQYTAIALITLLVGNLGIYLGAGLGSDATGSIGMAAGRTEPFQAANGVDVSVSAGELAQLSALKDVIEQNSRPGDAIVCFPYCPGIAFMTGRRLLFGNFFADDSWPAREPNWLPNAIARTRQEKPPVVIVMDWAINGTEVSRFDVWAASYVAALREMSREQRVMPGIAIYLL